MRILLIPSFCLCFSAVSAQQPWHAPSEAQKQKSPINLKDEKVISKGEKLFGSTCWTCHGEQGEGDGMLAESLDPKPANLTNSTIQQQTDGAFYWKISKGRGTMVGYEDALSDEQRWQLVAFIRSLAKRNEP